MSKGSVLDARELLRLIAEQQASLGKLQQMVIEHVLSETQLDLTTVTTWSTPASRDLVAPIDAPNVDPPAYETPTDTDVVPSTEPEPTPALPASTRLESGAALSDPPDATPPPPKELPAPTPSLANCLD